MSSKASKKSQKRKREAIPQSSPAQPWISMQSGIRIIAITSIVMAVLTTWQAIPAKGLLGGILWGLIFGALIWAVFGGMLLINRFLR